MQTGTIFVSYPLYRVRKASERQCQIINPQAVQKEDGVCEGFCMHRHVLKYHPLLISSLLFWGFFSDCPCLSF